MTCRTFLALLLLAMPARADVTLLGVAAIPGDAPDAAPVAERHRLGGLSAIAGTAKSEEYLLLADRGPAGDNRFRPRFHRFAVYVGPTAKPVVSVKLLGTTLLADEKGERLTGDPAVFDRRFDPEGLRVGSTGTVFVSDEFGPTIAEFTRAGKRVRNYPIPERFRTPKPGKTAEEELPPHATTGRVPNRGFEGLAISPDGNTLVALTQGPLLQDGALDKANKRAGRNCRLLELTLGTGAAREFVYQLDHPTHGGCEILAVNAGLFLVLERDAIAGAEAKAKRVYRVDTTKATDVSGVVALPAGPLPREVVPVSKTVVLDLLDPAHGIAGKGCPEKFEGLAFGPDLPDGRRLLLVLTDNDFDERTPTRLFAFAVDKSDLPGFRHQVFPR